VNNEFDAMALRNKHNVSKDSFVITYVGAYGVANHLDQILETANILRDKNIVFWLIGDGMEKAA